MIPRIRLCHSVCQVPGGALTGPGRHLRKLCHSLRSQHHARLVGGCFLRRCAGPRKVDIRLPGKGNSTSHGAKPVYENHLDDYVDSGQWLVNKELSLCTGSPRPPPHPPPLPPSLPPSPHLRACQCSDVRVPGRHQRGSMRGFLPVRCRATMAHTRQSRPDAQLKPYKSSPKPHKLKML
jgi:hypothetical protein